MSLLGIYAVVVSVMLWIRAYHIIVDFVEEMRWLGRQREIDRRLEEQRMAIAEADRIGKPAPDKHGLLWWPGGATVSLVVPRPCD